MKATIKPKCSVCGHYGHVPGKRCPLRGIVEEERREQKDAQSVQAMFPNRPDLVAMLEAMRASWVPRFAA